MLLEKSVYKSLMILKNNMKLCCTISLATSNSDISSNNGNIPTNYSNIISNNGNIPTNNSNITSNNVTSKLS